MPLRHHHEIGDQSASADWKRTSCACPRYCSAMSCPALWPSGMSSWEPRKARRLSGNLPPRGGSKRTAPSGSASAPASTKRSRPDSLERRCSTSFIFMPSHSTAMPEAKTAIFGTSGPIWAPSALTASFAGLSAIPPSRLRRSVSSRDAFAWSIWPKPANDSATESPTLSSKVAGPALSSQTMA